MNQQFIRIELGLTVSGFIVAVFILLIWLAGMIAIGMGIGRRWLR
jgi:hypothetical protein